MDHRYDTIVVGAGLAGLTTTVRLASAGRRVLLVERHSELGGRARTDDLDGFLFNQGAHALYRGGLGHQTLQQLGVEPDGEVPPTAGGQLAVGDSTTPLPVDVRGMLRTKALSPAGKLQFAKLMATIDRFDPTDVAGVSVEDWLSEYRPDVRRLARALVRLTTYAASTELLSADAAISQLVGATNGVLYLNGGWARLCRDLGARAVAGGAEIVSGVAVESVTRVGADFEVTGRGRRFAAATVIVAAGGPAFTARLLGIEERAFGPVGPPAHAAVLDLALDAVPQHRFVLGVDQPTYFSVHSPPARLAPVGKVAAVAMRYLAAGEDGSADGHRASLQHVAGLAGADHVVRSRFLRRMTVMNAIPIATAGGLAGRPGVSVPDVPGAFIAGDWVGRRGLLADAAIVSGFDAADAAERVRAGDRASAMLG